MRGVSCDEFAEAETRAERGLYRDYVEAGRALQHIRDDLREHWTDEYETWEIYVRERLGTSRGHANYMIQAAEVADSLESCDDAPRLPLRHAALLYRFKDVGERYRLAKKIQYLTFVEAQEVVRRRKAELEARGEPPPRYPREPTISQLRRLDSALKELDRVCGEGVVPEAKRLPQRSRQILARKLARVGKRLAALGAEVGDVRTFEELPNP